jgi:hypothetical protein
VEQRNDNTEPFVKRVTLPSGKSIEVLYFGEVAESASDAAVAATKTPIRPLHVCTECECALVYPTEWTEAGSDHWEVELRCPNCEWRGSGVFSQDIVEAFDDELDRGIDVLLSDYRSLVNANMEDEIERFAKALEFDAILPQDF